MSRLFWKFFFAFWLTLLAANLVVGAVIWLHKSAEAEHWDQHGHGQPPTFMLGVAATVLQHEGGYTEALARVAFLLTRSDEPLPLSRLEMRHELLGDYADYLPDMPLHEWRRVRGTQEVIVRHEPDEALASLPTLLAEPNARARLLALLDKLKSDKRVLGRAPTAAQMSMLTRIRSMLREKAPRRGPTLVRA